MFELFKLMTEVVPEVVENITGMDCRVEHVNVGQILYGRQSVGVTIRITPKIAIPLSIGFTLQFEFKPLVKKPSRTAITEVLRHFGRYYKQEAFKVNGMERELKKDRARWN